MNRFKYNRKGCVETGFDNSLDHQSFGHPSNPEYQDHEQSCLASEEFEGWFNSVEIQRDFQRACDKLKDNIFKVIDMNILFNAFHYVEKEQPKEEDKKEVKENEDYPF